MSRGAIRTCIGGLTAAAVLMSAGAVSAASGSLPHWQVVHRGGTADLRAISPVSSKVVWASGSNGTVFRTVNGGRSWTRVGPPGTKALEFRGMKAFDANHAVLMSIGNHPGDFRTYLTADGGRHWRITNQNTNPQAFYDCMAFFNRSRGLILSDPVNGRFRILITTNGGRSWHVNPAANMPRANSPNEYGFAASNQCITTSGSHDAWFGSGGTQGARVYRSTDGGVHWRVSRTPLRRGATAGVFAVAFRNSMQGFAIGGDFAAPTTAPRALALTADGGRTWTLVGNAPGGYRSGATWVPRTTGTALAVGLTGSDITTDGGFSWRQFASGSFDTVACTGGGSCWASGANARIGRLDR
ncbi:MAG: WD40/YVTN/BNR-like repeat-containing protein [Gaiellales bacterium]